MRLYLQNPNIEAGTIMVNGNAVAALGISVHGSEAKAWVLASERARKHVFTLCQVVSRELERATLERGLTKVTAHALADWRGAERFLKLLGFSACGRDGEYLVYEK